jgi:hypothetical protein
LPRVLRNPLQFPMSLTPLPPHPNRVKSDKERLKDEIIKLINEQEHEISRAEINLTLKNGFIKYQRVYLNKLK